MILGYLSIEHLHWPLSVGKRNVGRYVDFLKLLQIPGDYKEMGVDSLDFSA